MASFKPLIQKHASACAAPADKKHVTPTASIFDSISSVHGACGNSSQGGMTELKKNFAPTGSAAPDPRSFRAWSHSTALINIGNAGPASLLTNFVSLMPVQAACGLR
jgi:hypothetical protein